MFTKNLMKLSDALRGLEIRMIRDCSFSYAGKIPTALEKRVVSCAQEKHVREAIEAKGIVGIITTEKLASLIPDHFGLVIAEKPQSMINALQKAMALMEGFQWTDFSSEIHPSAIIHPGAHVAERNIKIGEGTIIMPGAIICERTIIGDQCIIGPGAIVGCDAFEVDTTRSPYTILNQSGGVLLEDHVEVQAKSTIVRATFGGFTTIRRESKMDCQVHVAHDCVIGERVQIAACAEISGRVNIGDDCFIGPNCSISNGLTIGESAFITIGAVVVRDVAAGAKVSGNFAVPHRMWIKFIKSISGS